MDNQGKKKTYNRDLIEKVKNYDGDVLDFMEKSSYFKTQLHIARCKICKLPKKNRMKIDKLILDGTRDTVIRTFIMENYPKLFNRTDNLRRCIRHHREYLPMLLDDVHLKSIFKRARNILENKDINSMSNLQKAEVISDIENQLMKEYSNVENERISLMNVMFREVLPLMVTRLSSTIVTGNTRSIKEITDASSMLFKMTTALASSGIDKSDIDDSVYTGDFKILNDGESEDTKGALISLKDKIDKATQGM